MLFLELSPCWKKCENEIEKEIEKSIKKTISASYKEINKSIKIEAFILSIFTLILGVSTIKFLFNNKVWNIRPLFFVELALFVLVFLFICCLYISIENIIIVIKNYAFYKIKYRTNGILKNSNYMLKLVFITSIIR